MNHRSAYPKYLFFLISSILFLLVCSCKQKPSVDHAGDGAEVQTAIEIKADKSNFLYCTKAADTVGSLEYQPGDVYRWRGDASLTWEVNVPAKGDYELYLIACVWEGGRGETLSFETNDNIYEFTLEPTIGPYSNKEDFIAGRNYQRVKLTSKVPLAKGIQKLKLYTEGITIPDSLLEIRSIELLPYSAKEILKEEEERAVAARASVDWMIETGYGLMVHWTSWSIQKDGSIKSYAGAVAEFDVDAFTDMVEEMGVGYVCFTIGHAEQYCPAPIESWEKIHPGKTTDRDLIAEIADAMDAKGIKLLLYMHTLGTANFHSGENERFFMDFKNILEEFGNRYKEKLAGYWFDCWYQLFEGYPDFPFEEFYRITKTGNAERPICLNSWLYPAVTPWQDYWAAEVLSFIELPEKGYAKSGPVTNLPYHALLMMEPYWVLQDIEISEPRFTSAQLAQFISDCQDNRGIVTVNIGIYQDGTVSDGALQVMKEVKSQLRSAD